MKRYIMALDQGTSSSRCILFNERGQAVSVAQKEFTQIYPEPGYVEHDPMEIWSTQIGVAQEAMYKIGATHANIAAIGITNQRETTVVWDKVTGRPVYNAIVWQCRRTADVCDRLKEGGYTSFFQEKTGLLIDAYFSATKLCWILDQVPGARKRAERGELLFGTIDSWLIWNLTKGRVHATDYTNAARTMMFNIHTLQWDPDILTLLSIPKAMLPQALPSSQVYGTVDSSIFGGDIPIASAAGDQQAALFGQTCFQEGDAKNTYGTGCFLLMNTGKKPVESKKGLLTTIAWGLDGTVNYALEGSIFVAGAAIQWLRDELKLIETAADSQWISQEAEDTGGVYVVPAFTGLGAPYWNAYARGTVVGLSRGTNRGQLVRATLESLAYQTIDILKAMEEDSQIRLSTLNVDGGACANDFLMQFQADLTGTQVKRPACIETTALGAAYLAGLAVGYWSDQEEVMKNKELDRVFLPNMEASQRQSQIRGWNRAVRCALAWADEEQEGEGYGKA